MMTDTEVTETVVQSVVTILDPQTVEAAVQFAMYFGFIGIAGGSFIGVACRAVMAVVHIFDKITK